jgi:streptogramin lyase
MRCSFWLRSLRTPATGRCATRRTPLGHRLRLEVLETRCLLTLNFTSFPIPTPGSGPAWITAGFDGNLWFTEYNGNNIGRITPSGAITEFPLPTPHSDPLDITAGPDGNIWFTELTNTKIGRITPGGAITEFPIPSGSSTEGITAGPDGNVWFTEPSANKIGSITPSGNVSEFASPVGNNSIPTYITAGTDGNLWYLLANSNDIGRITPSGSTATFADPAGSNPAASNNIVTGPDGNLWFADFNVHSIERLTTGGNFSSFGTPTSPFSNEADAVGPDGNVWFTAPGGNGGGFLARVSPTGAIATFPFPSGSFPGALAAGPDGNLWVTDGNAIDRVPLLFSSGSNLNLAVGQTFSGQVAFFRALDASATASDYTATINWGDGSPPTLGLVGGNAAAGFPVNATHTYTQVGTYSATVSTRNVQGLPPPTLSGLTGLPAFVPSNTSDSFTVTVGPATHLAFLQQPDSTFASQLLSPAVTVAVVDSNDNIVFGDNTSVVTLTLGTNADGATLGGAVSATVVHGVATFSNLSLNRPGNGYTLLAADGGLVGGQSAPFNITTLDVAVGSDNQTRLLWDNVDGVARFWSINNSFQPSNPTDNGPYIGYMAQKIATGSDGLTRVLWTRNDGLTSLWIVNAANVVLSSHNFGPYPGWTAVDVTVGSDNQTRLLWDNVSGQISVWTLDNNFNATNPQYYGPYTGWTGQSIAAGADGVTRLLWDNVNGAAALGLLNASNVQTSGWQTGSEPGWTARDVTVGSDNKTRLLWENVSGLATLWTVDNNGNVTNQQYYGPYAGFIATALAAGADGLTRLVWTAPNGNVVLTLLNADNTVNSSITYPLWANGTLPDVVAPAVPTASSGPSPVLPAAPAAATTVALAYTPVEDTPATRPTAKKKAATEPHHTLHSVATQAHKHATTKTPAKLGPHHRTAHHAEPAPRKT